MGSASIDAVCRMAFRLFLFVCLAFSASAAQWRLKSSSNAAGFAGATWVSMEDNTTVSTGYNATDEYFVLSDSGYASSLYPGYSAAAVFSGKSLQLGSVKDGKTGQLRHYYSKGIHGTHDVDVQNDGLILEKGAWYTEYGSVKNPYSFYGKVTVNAIESDPFRIIRNNTVETELRLMDRLSGSGWIQVEGYHAPMYTLELTGGYGDFSGGAKLVPGAYDGVETLSRLRLPDGACSATVEIGAGCRLAATGDSVTATLGKISCADGAVLEFKATGTGSTAESRDLTCSSFVVTTGFEASGAVNVEVYYDDSANGKFSDSFDLLTVPASSSLDVSKFVFVPTDNAHASATFSVRVDGDTKTLVMTCVGTGADLLYMAENGTNAKGFTGVKWSDGSTGTSPEYDYACVGNSIFISSEQNESLRVFNGNSLRIGDAASNTEGFLRHYGGANAIGTDIPTFPGDGIVLACGAWAPRYAHHYMADGKVTVTATSGSPFRFYHDMTERESDCSLTLLGPLCGSGSLQVDGGVIKDSSSTNFCVNLFGGAEEFTGTLNVLSQISTKGFDCRAGIGLTNGFFGGSIVLGPRSYLDLPLAGDAVTVRDMTISEDAELNVRIDTDRGAVGSVTVTNAFAMPSDVRSVKLNVSIKTVSVLGGDYAILTVPAESGISAAAFDLSVQGGDPYVEGATLSVVETEDGDSLVLSIPESTIVSWEPDANDLNGNQLMQHSLSLPSSMTNAQAWSDGRVPHEGVHYLCSTEGTGARILRTRSDTYLESEVFPGESLKLAGVDGDITFVPTHVNYTIPLLVFSGRVNLHPSTAGVTLHADIFAESGISLWSVYAGKLFKVDGDVAGPGEIKISGNGVGSGNPGGDVEFVGDNSGFSGRLTVTTSGNSAGTVPSMDVNIHGVRSFERLFVSDGNNLGGAMPEFDPQGVVFEAYSQLITRNSLTIDVPTRGWQIGTCGRFNVTNAEDTLTFRSPLAFYGTLRKEGPGVLALGNPAPTFGADGTATSPDTESVSNNMFVVSQGSVKILGYRCLDGVDIVVDNGGDTAFILPTDPGDDDLVRYGLFNCLAATPFSVDGEDGKLTFAFDGAGPDAYPKTYGLCTVSAASADAVAGLIQVKPPRFNGVRSFVTVRRTDNSDGTTTFAAVLEGPKGMVIHVK